MLHAYIPDGDEPSEWIDVRREERERERVLRYMRLGRARVLCALGSPTPEDMEQIEQVLRERREARR